MNRHTKRSKLRSPFARPALSVMALSLVMGAAIPSTAQNYSFSSVRVDGNRMVEDATILSYAGIARGESVSAARLNDAARAIRETGLFESVNIAPQGGTLVIAVTERPIVNRINFEGNSGVSDDNLKAIIESVPRRPFSPEQAEEDTRNIAQAYADRGRVNAIVTPKIIRRPNDRVDLVFEINEGGVSEVERISFVGNRRFSDSQLRGALETKQAGVLRALIKRDTFSPDRLEFDQRVLTDFYRSRGYADFRISGVNADLTDERDATVVTFNVIEGQQFHVGPVTISSEYPGLDPVPFRDQIRLRPGQVYSPDKVDADIQRMEDLAVRMGVRFLRVEPQIQRDDRGVTLGVNYALTQGERVFIERIDISGNTATLDRVVRNQFTAAEGDAFNPRQIRASAERIRALGFFGNADVDTRPGSTADQVIVDVNVEEAPTGSLSFGANYSTDFGAGLVANFKETNFLGRGQRLNFAVSTAKSNRNFSFAFTEPALLGRDVIFGLGASYRTTDNESALYDTATGRLSPSIGFPIGQKATLGLSYTYEYTDLTDVSGNASVIIKNEAQRGGIGTHALGYTLLWDSARNSIDDETWRVRAQFGQDFGFGDDVEFIRTEAKVSAQTRLWRDAVTLRGTIEGGLLEFSEGSSRVTDRYFMGSQIMRGFEPGGIGPRDANTDDALGGNAYAVARLEAQFPLGLPEEYGISGGAFIDYGATWDVGETYGANVLYNDWTPRTIAGVSIFWDTPVGPLRFNFTEALDAQDRDQTKNFDLTIQTKF